MHRFRVSLFALLATCAVVIVVALPTSGPTAAAQDTTERNACKVTTRQCAIAVARTYLDALVSHDGSQIKLAKDAKRWENGILTGRSGPDIKSQMPAPYFKVVKRLRDIRWFLEGDNLFAMYLIDTGVPDSPAYTGTVHVSELFVIRNGLIHEVEAIFCAASGTTTEPSRTDSGTNSTCFRAGLIRS